MARHFSIPSFFRQVPNALLGRYFAQQGLMGDLDFASVSETKPEAIFEAWLQLPETERNRIDAEFRVIFDLSCEKGFKAILDEAESHFHGDDHSRFVDHLADLPNHYHRAMVTFLDYDQLWNGAVQFCHADSLRYWRKRKNMGHAPAAVDRTSVRALASSISGYFRRQEGRGNHCVVETHKRGDRDYFFAYPEDYSQQSVEWVEGEFGRRPHNPAFEVVFIYSQSEGSLDLYYRGPRPVAEPLQQFFSQDILKLAELPADPKDERVYDLNPLMQKSFEFAYDVGSGVQSVTVRKLRLSSRVNLGDRITLEADSTENPKAVYELMARIDKSEPLDLYYVTQAELVALIDREPGKKPKAVTFRITYPNSCSLKYDDQDLSLREVLGRSGIEPRAPLVDA